MAAGNKDVNVDRLEWLREQKVFEKSTDIKITSKSTQD